MSELPRQLEAILQHLEQHPNVWAQSPVSLQPEKILDQWMIVKAVIKQGQNDNMRPSSFHFVGRDRKGDGAVSSPIMSFDSIRMEGVTRSGRIYRLQGLPSWNADASYVLKNWAKSNCLEVADATQEFIALHHVNLDHVAQLEKLSQPGGSER